jgi:hypothetical protein
MTEAVPAEAPPPRAPKAQAPGRFTGQVGSGLLLTAIMSWAGGVAAHYGYHVSAPFLPTWVLLLVAVLGTGHFTHVIASMWHYEKTNNAAQIRLLERSAELYAEEYAKQQLPGLVTQAVNTVAKDAGLQ